MAWANVCGLRTLRWVTNSGGTVVFNGSDTGQRFDAESGFSYFKNRYYSQDIGRFLSRDPQGYESALGLYEYAAGRVTIAEDLLGLLTLLPESSMPAACSGCCDITISWHTWKGSNLENAGTVTHESGRDILQDVVDYYKKAITAQEPMDGFEPKTTRAGWGGWA